MSVDGPGAGEGIGEECGEEGLGDKERVEEE